ncbi:CreA family protein [Paraburkholderia sp. RL17-368-BIF-A]|jgi:CreA protein|uniref:CreA family protein n=1 Tax=Paraburkholderia sp. RL17-368-BIF-A TaxID=3031628 RepID=UPI0006B3F7DB|nr:CreA family protein [Burkholderia sp. HB1]
MKQRVRGRSSITGALLIFLPPAALADELASMKTYSQRYGNHITISAYSDPLVKGVTCYVTESYSDDALGGRRISRAHDLAASCHQTGELELAVVLPAREKVFGTQQSPIFESLHVFRIVDRERHALLYFSYSEDEAAGDLPGRLYVIPLRADLRMPK